MKKFVIICLLSFGIFFTVVAQNSASTANKNTALRCLKLAENCLMGNDWQNALSQAELGLSYDDSISDLYYIKAAAGLNLGGTKAEAIRLISSAFEKGNWAGYTKNGARIFLADLLSDTGFYEESLSALDTEPFIYSADAEFIRIKNYYRMGTVESLSSARQRLNSDRRIYPSDSRFPEIFFMFESLFMNEAERNGIHYKVPQIVQNIADSYILKLPDYSDSNPEMELMAASFATGEDSLRLIKAIEAKNNNQNILLAIAALRAGIYTDSQAFDMFFGAADGEISLDMLETFIALLSDNQIIEQAGQLLTDFTGTIYIDENMDLQYEFSVQYEKGRPQFIKYDGNNDGETELSASCDFGSPIFTNFNSDRVQVYYDVFPRVSKIVFSDLSLTFNFLHDDMKFSPFDFVTDNVFSRTGVNFYIPYISSETAVPLPKELTSSASSFELPITERDDARIVYTLSDGNIIFADFYEKDFKYAYCDFSGSSIVRQVDYNNDGYFETTEYYSDITDDMKGVQNDDNRSLVSSVFNFMDDGIELYLRKVQIDRNANTYYEFNEEYLEYNGKITTWDNDDNGLPDCQYIRYPKQPGDSLIEETIYFDSNGLKEISITIADGVAMKMTDGGKEGMIYGGEHGNLYWIDFKGTMNFEDALLQKITGGIEQGRIDIVEIEGERVSVIKIGKNIFCRYIPPSEFTEVAVPDNADESQEVFE